MICVYDAMIVFHHMSLLASVLVDMTSPHRYDTGGRLTHATSAGVEGNSHRKRTRVARHRTLHRMMGMQAGLGRTEVKREHQTAQPQAERHRSQAGQEIS
ncbi:hypothetical protein THAOC_12072 [Thalassiosira oceanica]|uniref:Secreted protein n=1 Tax=Thalassiosira oceanica TaxID=159749 RepID=K0SPM7_THAOC|nr:hypothetical protein THAOC_12072 [Thalassiosira oceanica]|eukprot:EJK66954.1 hypothetical protein THAOC_12072 [Thalassiosira oceanica]